MRKKIASLIVALAFMFSGAVLLASCGQAAKATSFSVDFVSTTYTIENGAVVVMWSEDLNINLDASNFKVTATFNDNSTKVVSLKSETQPDGYTYTSTIPAGVPTPIGDYKITFAYENLKPFVVDIKVVKKTIDMSRAGWNYTQPYQYSGFAQEVRIVNLPHEVNVEYQGNLNVQTYPGVYRTRAVFTTADPANTSAIPDMELVWEIKKADIRILSVNDVTFDYDGTERVVVKEDFSQNLPAGVEIKQLSGTTSATNAGNYSVLIKFEYTNSDKDYFNPIADLTWIWRIKAVSYTDVGTATISDQSVFDYDGLAKSVVVDTTNLNTNVEVASINGLSATNSGTHTVTVNLRFKNPELNINYNRITPITLEWQINKRPLSVTAQNHTIAYGQEGANNGFVATGYVNNETDAVLLGTAEYLYGTYTAGNGIGNYDITVSGLSATNYDITFHKGTLIVEKANLVVRANDQTIDFGDAVQEAGVSTTGLFEQDQLSTFGTLAFDYDGYTSGSNAGEYAITVSGLSAENYNIEYQPGVLTVQKIDVPLSVREAVDRIELNTISAHYTGEQIGLPTVMESTLPEEVTIKNISLKNGGQLLSVGIYQILIEVEYWDATNYNPIAAIERGFQILPVEVDVGSLALVQTHFDYSGMPHTVEIANLPQGASVIDTEDVTQTNAGEYLAKFVVYCGGGGVSSTVEAELAWEINPGTLEITLTNKTITFGDAVPVDIGQTVTGFVNDETEAVLQGIAQFAFDGYFQDADVGTYSITMSGVVAQNYVINVVPGTLTVNPRTIDVGGAVWGSTTQFEYTGTEIKPPLQGLPFVGVAAEYTYKLAGQTDPINPVAVGAYVASVVLNPKNGNYTLQNTEKTEFEFEIIKAKIDLADLAWNTPQSVAFTGQPIKPVFEQRFDNLVITYSYVDQTTLEPVENPTSQGTYIATAHFEFDEACYELINEPANIRTFEFQITLPQA